MRTSKKIQEPWDVEMEIVDGSLRITLINKRTGEVRLCSWTKEEAAIFCFGAKYLKRFGKDTDAVIA